MKYYTLKNAGKDLLYRIDFKNGISEKFSGTDWEPSETAMEAFGLDGGELLSPISELEARELSEKIRGNI